MRALSSATALRVVIGITIYFIAISLFVFFFSERNLNIPDGLVFAVLFVNYSFFLGMPVRWALMLLLILRSIRVRPLTLLPAASILQIAVAVAIHFLLGLLSLVGWLTVWTVTSTGDRVFGLILHALVPALTIVWVYRRSSTAPSFDGPPPPHGRSDRTAQEN